MKNNPENLLKIYVCAHKKFDTSIVPNKCYEILYDSECNNYLNNIKKTYSEGYHIYEIIKNKNIDKYKYIGICHYRRYYNISVEEIIEYMDKFDCIVINPPGLLNYTVYSQFNLFFGENGNKDIKLIGSIIKHNYNDYFKSYLNVMNDNIIYPYNMSIMTINNWKNCYNWCFDILDKFVKHHNWKSFEEIYEYYKNNTYKNKVTESELISNARICGHILERLMTIYIKHNFNKIKSIPVKIYSYL